MRTIQLFLLLTAALLSSNCKDSKPGDLKASAASAGDVSFARKTFEALARGDSAVADQIDWPVFTAMGENLGINYVAITSGIDKEKFVTGFITQFATSFRESGGSIDNFSNWRVTLHDPQRTEVSADSINGALTVVVASRDNRRRVISINVVK